LQVVARTLEPCNLILGFLRIARHAAWGLMGLIALFSNMLLGYRERRTSQLALLILPVIASIAFFLIADIDSPRGGVIQVAPQNLISVSQFIKAQQQGLNP